MAFKFVLFLALVAFANAGLLPAAKVYHAAPADQMHHVAPFGQVYHAAPTAQLYHAAPAIPVHHEYHVSPTAVIKAVAPVAHYAAYAVLAKTDDEFNSHPQYKYNYNVHDVVSGNYKAQVQERDGDVVRGEYSLIDADGYKRIVKYTADDQNGFNAVVEREPLVKTEHAHALVKTVTVPSVLKTGAPVTHYSNPAYTTFSSPSHYAVNY